MPINFYSFGKQKFYNSIAKLMKYYWLIQISIGTRIRIRMKIRMRMKIRIRMKIRMRIRIRIRMKIRMRMRFKGWEEVDSTFLKLHKNADIFQLFTEHFPYFLISYLFKMK